MTDLSEIRSQPPGPDLARRFGGVARLYGPQAAAGFAAAHVVVIGIGGVGCWTAEALARSGVGRLTLIDLDHIAESNANRQIHALGEEFGRAKVLAMADRICAINPQARVDAIEEFIAPDNVERTLPDADVVLDCIDQVSAKAALLAHCRARSVAVVTCGAAGGRVDPTRIRNDDLARATGDPLLSKLRYRLRRVYGFPREGQGGRIRRFGVDAVFSDEPVRMPVVEPCDLPTGAPSGLACAGYGSVVTVTASLGFAAAAIGLRVLAARAASPPAQRP